MFRLVQLGPHCTGTPLRPQTCSNLFNLNLTVRGLVHYVRQADGWHPTRIFSCYDCPSVDGDISVNESIMSECASEKDTERNFNGHW